MRWPDKDPNDIDRYGIDWSARFGTDEVVSASWTVPLGITLRRSEIDGQRTTIWLEGGTPLVTYTITCRAVSMSGREVEQSVELRVADR